MCICRSEYTEEGDGPLILVSAEILSKLEKLIVNGFGTQNIERVVDESLLLILAENISFEERSK